MANVLIVAYLLIVIALIVVILLQRSEGGALGIGGSGGGFMTARGSANLLTRTTAILATLFFATAIGLTILSELDRGTSSILDNAAEGTEEGGNPTTVLDALDALQGGSTGDLPVPAIEAPAAGGSNIDALDLAVPDAPAAGTTPLTEAPATEAPAPANANDVPAPANSATPAAPTGN